MQNKLLIHNSIALFNDINESLEGSKHYTKKETKENRDNFVSAILHNDKNYLKEYYHLLNDDQIVNVESLLR